MTWDIVLGCMVIVIARIGDVSLGTLRTVAVVSGHRSLAWIFGLVEVIIWVFVVSAVIEHLQSQPAYGIAFAIGAATGNFVGVTLQRRLPFGHQVVRVFTRRGEAILDQLHREGLRATEFCGRGRDGAVSMLFVQVRRSRTAGVIRSVRKVDPACFYTIDDIRDANTAPLIPLPVRTQP